MSSSVHGQESSAGGLAGSANDQASGVTVDSSWEQGMPGLAYVGQTSAEWRHTLSLTWGSELVPAVLQTLIVRDPKQKGQEYQV